MTCLVAPQSDDAGAFNCSVLAEPLGTVGAEIFRSLDRHGTPVRVVVGAVLDGH